MKRIANIGELNVNDIPYVGGKGANLGELTGAGFHVPEAFVLTTIAYDYYMRESGLLSHIKEELAAIDRKSDDSLTEASQRIRAMFNEHEIPKDLRKEILSSFKSLFSGGKTGFVAVRSSATAEDLPDASFAGQQDSYLNVSTADDLIDKVRKCWSSLFTPRAIAYRERQGFAHEDVKLAVVVQKMVNSDISGIMFTIEPNTNEDCIIIEAGYGLGEAIVGGEVTPDTYLIDKSDNKILKKRVAKQTWKYIKGPDGKTIKTDVPADYIQAQKLTDTVIAELSEVGKQIEIHYERPMDVEWCIEDKKIYIVQARPITALKNTNGLAEECVSNGMAKVITNGLGASPGLASGKVRFLDENMSLEIVKDGDILVTTMTMPDMVPAMSRAAAIVTDEGGMTCHAAIVSRELGTPCVVGTGDATTLLKENMLITVDGTTGTVYEGDQTKGSKDSSSHNGQTLAYAPSAPITGTKIMVNVGIPQKAEEVAAMPVDGVGLMRSEFLFTSYVGEHPMSLVESGRSTELVEKLAGGIAVVARAFYPRPVILRTSDFKTNEYRDMKGGADYEPRESNPMIGWRGCSRYISDNYREAYKCELQAIKKVRDSMGMKNVFMMLPFVRGTDELDEIVAMMAEVGLKRSKDFKLYLMAEVPVNIFMADVFCDYCDGFSIGSNDLTQLIMGADRDSDILGRMGYFDERNEGVKRAIRHLIKVAHKHGKTVGICGQGPSVYPEFTEFLVREGIDSISLNPDTAIATKISVASLEQRIMLETLRDLKGRP